MKVYVDENEKPKSCSDCRWSWCGICKISPDIKYEICPLQSLTDHDKQIRNEVVQEIREKLEPYFNLEGDELIDTNDLERILDQIKGEENGKINSK